MNELMIPQTALFIITVAGFGVIGGFVGHLYALSGGSRRLQLNGELLTALLMGFGGAHVVFLIMPGSFDIEGAHDWVKLAGISFLGGFAGRSVIDRVLPSLIAKAQRESVQQSRALAEKVDEANAEALALVSRQLDTGEFGESVGYQQLLAAIAQASAATKVQVFQLARTQRKLSEGSRDEAANIERTLPVFQALIELDSNERFHRPRGQLAYALIKLGRKADAIAAFDKAIEIRERRHESGFWLYEYSRAKAQIESVGEGSHSGGVSSREDVLQDLKYACQDSRVHQLILQDHTIRDWLKGNFIGVEQLAAS